MARKTVSDGIELDAIAWKILEGLQQNARQSFAELGRRVGLSTPAVAERVHRLEEAGVITGYHASVNTAMAQAQSEYGVSARDWGARLQNEIRAPRTSTHACGPYLRLRIRRSRYLVLGTELARATLARV